MSALLLTSFGAPAGPTPVVPVGGGPPGAFPNLRVSAVNVVARGSTTFNGNVEITAYEGAGPVPWTVTKYNRGDIAMRLAPANPAAADANTLHKGFTDFTTPTDASVAEAQSWRPSPVLGVAIPTARQNGPIDWGDGEGPFCPTVAISAASSGPGYDMVDGSFGTGQLDVNLGRAGTHGSSPEGNFGFSVTWFPYDEGWLAGNVGNPVDPFTGGSQWNGAGQHAAGLSAGLMTWAIPPSPPGDGATYGGLGPLRLPGVNAETNGMLFATSSNGDSDVNTVGVAPTNDVATGRFVIQSRKATTDTVSDLTDANFYFAWVDFANPLRPPAGPTLRAKDAVAVTDGFTVAAKEGNLAINTDEPEVLVTTIDQFNSGGYGDPTSGGNPAIQTLIGYFYDPRTLTQTRGPFFIMGNANGNGEITRHDVKYNPVSKQYVVVGCARMYSPDGTDVLMIARVNPNSVAGANEPLVDVFAFDGLTDAFASALSYDDVSVAVSSANGNFLLVAEHKEDSPSGEGSYGILFSSDGTVLTPRPNKLDLLQPTGDVDDPDVAYLPKKDVFLYFSNTDFFRRDRQPYRGLGDSDDASRRQPPDQRAGTELVAGHRQPGPSGGDRESLQR